MLATILIILPIVAYSGWIIYKAIKHKMQGKCDYCVGCSMNGACPIQAVKQEQEMKELHLKI